MDIGSLSFNNRSLVQIKSHAQKVLKRFDAGEVRTIRMFLVDLDVVIQDPPSIFSRACN
jgi:hypothetical protein